VRRGGCFPCAKRRGGARVRGRGVGESSTREADVAAEKNQVCRVHPARNRATVRVFCTWRGFVPGPGRLRDSSRRASSRRTVVVYNRSEKSLYFLLPHNLLEAWKVCGKVGWKAWPRNQARITLVSLRGRVVLGTVPVLHTLPRSSFLVGLSV